MKKTFAFAALLAAMFFMLSGGSSVAKEALPAPGPMNGDWYIEYTWQDYSPGYAYWYIKAGQRVGIFKDSQGNMGMTKYDSTNKAVTLKYSVGTVYSGYMDTSETYMSGTMESYDGYPGTWQAWENVTEEVTKESNRGPSGE